MRTTEVKISSDEKQLPLSIPKLLFIIMCHAGAFYACVLEKCTWDSIVVCLVLVFLTHCVGISIGYHRLLAHRSFSTYRLLEFVFVIFGILAMQGHPLEWVATHRRHHRNSDTKSDPHSPSHGFLWAYIGWILQTPSRIKMSKLLREPRDLMATGFYRRLRKASLPLQLLLSLILYQIGGINYVLWGIFMRLTITYHFSWLLASIPHSWGYQRYATRDKSGNVAWLALLTWGEGWHNNHHAFPNSARIGIRRIEIDIGWLVIKVLTMLRLVWNVQQPLKPQLADADD